MVKVLVADKLPEEAVNKIKELDTEVFYDPGLKDRGLLDAVRKIRPSVIIVRSTKIEEPVIGADPGLSLIIRAGAGYNTIDVDAASRKGVFVANCPGKNAVAVAELAMGLILGLDRKIPDNVIQLRQGIWNKAGFSKARGIKGSVLAVIGTGRIGREVILRARAFGMKVKAWSRSLTPEDAAELGVEYCSSIIKAPENADYVSIHLALNDDTRGIIGREFLSVMKPGSALINTARAELVDQSALLDGLNNRDIAAGLDVYSDEPAFKEGEYRGEIASHPSVYGTHHIGASTEQAQNAVAAETIRILGEYIKSGSILNCVNLMEKTPAKYILSVRHHNRVGVLADILRIIRENDINVETMENIVLKGAHGACANIQIDDGLAPDALDGLLNSSDDVYDVKQTQIH